jgi:hypothetical protein
VVGIAHAIYNVAFRERFAAEDQPLCEREGQRHFEDRSLLG